MPDIKAIMELWFQLRETPTERLKIYEFSRRNPWDYSIRKDLEQAFDLDPDGLTALLLLDNFRSDFFSCCGLSLQDLLENEASIRFLRDCRTLTDLLASEEIVHALNDFVGNISHAVTCMGICREDVNTMLNDRYDLALLRRDALRSMDTLQLHQFFQGDLATDHLVYIPDIHVFWNVNSLIRCAWQSPNGVSINLIRDPLNTSSFFAFVAKNGGNLTILTDKPREAHPLSKYMTRRPERDFTERMFRHHFPYGLLDVEFDRKGYAHPGDTSLVPLQTRPIKVGSITELEPDEILWTVMMFSLIDAKLYKENYHCGQLSYTSDMIADPELHKQLLPMSSTGALMVHDYKPLTAPFLTANDTDEDAQYENYTGHGLYFWLYDRYKDEIPAELLNGLAPSGEQKLFLMPDNTTFLAPKDRLCCSSYGSREVSLLEDGPVEERVLPDGRTVRIDHRKRVEGATAVQKMTGDEFGSAEDLMRDYRWHARYNAAKFVRKRAEEEFAARKDEVSRWLKDRITQNLETICRDIIRDQFTERKEKHPCQFSMVALKGEWYQSFSTRDCLLYVKSRTGNPRDYPLQNNSMARCWFADNAPCSFLLRASAVHLEDLLYLTGCRSAEDLPDVLRHWHHSHHVRPYTGNSILQRIDPMDWVLKSPWDDLRFDPVIGIGKKFLFHVKRDLGILS